MSYLSHIKHPFYRINVGKWYDVGVFKGKKALLCMTTGAPEFMYNPDGIQGDIDTVSYI